MASHLLPLPLTAQTLLSTYSLYLSLSASRSMRTYEPISKKAATHSSTADTQLWRTRTTLGAAIGTSILSLVTAVVPLLRTHSATYTMLATVLDVAVLVYARRYIAGFWEGKMNVPGAGAYNEAVVMVRTLLVVMRWVILVAGVGGVVAALKAVMGA